MACDICARSKTSHRPPAGLLHPLPIPDRPWSSHHPGFRHWTSDLPGQHYHPDHSRHDSQRWSTSPPSRNWSSPVAVSALSPPAPTPPPPRTLESGDLVWEVSRILAVHRHGRGFHYLVDWGGGMDRRTAHGSLGHTSQTRDCCGTFTEKIHEPSDGRKGVSRREGGPVVGSTCSHAPQHKFPARSRVLETRHP